MILVTGIPTEPPLAAVIHAAEERGIPCVVFNQRSSGFYDFQVGFNNNRLTGHLTIEGRNYGLDDFDGIYVRLMDHHFLPENQRGIMQGGVKNSERSRLIHEMMIHWLDVTDTPIMNHPSAMASNVSKPYQAQLIAECGFSIPETIVTNIPAEARQFAARHGKVIFKSISSIRSIVSVLDTRRMKRLDQIAFLPTQFQSYVDGVNVRVHVVGDTVFPTRIDSDAVDYRYASTAEQRVQMEAIELPSRVNAMCLQISERLDLPLCGIDLKVTPTGEYFCFEVNPCPGFSYFQQMAGQDIAGAIVDYLARKGNAPSASETVRGSRHLIDS